MKITLAENIRNHRRERGLTQEQLAEAMGVSVGAVSKWESGSSVPDICLIIGLAELFETSVDVLLGYELKSGGAEKALDELLGLFREKRFDEAVPLAEKLLLKYPNNFEVVYRAAMTYNMKGMEQRNNRELGRALELYQRAMPLLGQNTSERINEWYLRNTIARVHLTMGQLEKGLEILKSNNAEGVNDADIGCVLAREEGRQDEAAKYLSSALLSHAMKMVNIVTDFANVYDRRGQADKALESFRWVCSFVESLTISESVGYMKHILVSSLTGCAAMAFKLGDRDGAAEYMRLARDKALEFDAAPDYSFGDMRFCEGKDESTGFTDFGTSAMEGIVNSFSQQEDDSEGLIEIWNELR